MATDTFAVSQHVRLAITTCKFSSNDLVPSSMSSIICARTSQIVRLIRILAARELSILQLGIAAFAPRTGLT